MINYALIGRAMLHPTAASILDTLQRVSPASPNMLARLLDEQLGNVSYHVAILAGKKGRFFVKTPLLALDHTEPRRGAVEHFYRLTEAAVVGGDIVAAKGEGRR